MKKVEAWKCDFCERVYTRSVSTANHQRACRCNPARRNCITCKHSRLEMILREYSPLNIEPTEVWAPWCSQHEKQISEKPYFDECELIQNDHTEDEPIPGTCFYYEYKGCAGWGKPKPEKGGTS